MIEGINGKIRYSIDPKDIKGMKESEFKAKYDKVLGIKLEEVYNKFVKTKNENKEG